MHTNRPQAGLPKQNNMDPLHFDLITIGGGSAGYAAANAARELVERVAIIDTSKDLGGLCIRRGCMPSKTVIYSAEVLHHARHPGRFGLTIPRAEADMPAIRRRKQAMVDDFAEYRVKALQSDRFSLFRQKAHFIDPHTLELEDGTRLHGDKILISTGSVVSWPPVPGLDTSGALTSDEILDLDYLPESIIVLGGGIVACELAQYLNRVGSRVIQIQRSPRILKELPAGAAAVIEQAFRDEGIELYTGTSIQQVERLSDDTVSVRFQQGGETRTATAHSLFNALGRRPNTDSLHLEAAGVNLLPSGHIDCTPNMQTSVPHIYAAGDVAGPVEIVHVAINQGLAAVRHAFGEEPTPLRYDGTLTVLFTDPQVATAGLTPEELEKAGTPYLTASYPFDDHGKSILMEARYGYVQIQADPGSGRILGAVCVGKDAGELIHALNVAIGLQATVFDLLKIDWYHPTLSEIWEYPLEEIAEKIQ